MAIVSVTVDVWELRCRFNRGRYWRRLKANEFDFETKDRPADPKYRLGPGGLSQEVYYIHKTTGVQIARVHQLVMADGVTLGGGGKPDPKELLEGETLYHLHGGSDQAAQIRRDPSLGYPEGVCRYLYKRWRWLKCKLVGR
jgi:hypothetical protein